jgi:hypothetical protein
MSDNDTLNGNGESGKVDVRFLELLARYYTVEMLEDWLARANGGMRVRENQVARWERTLTWLRQAQEQAGDGD